MTLTAARSKTLHTLGTALPRPYSHPGRAVILEVMTIAALAGHDLGPFDEVDNGYQAACRRCGMTVWVGRQGLIYSLLGDECGEV